MKRLTIIILVVVIIGIAFYLGYQQTIKTRYPEAIKSAYTHLIPTFNRKPQKAEEKLILEFIAQYTLAPEQNLKYISPPFFKGRTIYYQCTKPAQIKGTKAPENIFFCWYNQNTCGDESMTFSKTNLSNVLTQIGKIYPYEIEGNQTILNQELTGDFIYRKNISQEELITGLETIYQNQLHQPVKFRFQEVPRKVYIARGLYQFHPIFGRESQIEIYKEKLGSANEGATGAGNYEAFIRYITVYLNCRVIDEVANPPSELLRWHYDINESLYTSPAPVLQHITEQTGLTFTEEIRTVKVLFIE